MLIQSTSILPVSHGHAGCEIAQSRANSSGQSIKRREGESIGTWQRHTLAERCDMLNPYSQTAPACVWSTFILSSHTCGIGQHVICFQSCRVCNVHSPVAVSLESFTFLYLPLVLSTFTAACDMRTSHPNFPTPQLPPTPSAPTRSKAGAVRRELAPKDNGAVRKRTTTRSKSPSRTTASTTTTARTTRSKSPARGSTARSNESGQKDTTAQEKAPSRSKSSSVRAPPNWAEIHAKEEAKRAKV